MRAPSAAVTIQIDCDGRIASWPDGARDMFGRIADAALGRPLGAFIEPRQRDACDNVVNHLCRDTRPGAVHTMELLARRPDDATFHIECSLWRSAADASRFDVLIRDVTNRVRIEEDLRQQLRDLRRFSASQIQELQRTQSRFRDIADTIDEVFWMADPSVTRMLYISPAYERLWGRTCESLYQEPRSFIEAIHPDDRARVGVELLRQRDSLPFDHEYRIIRPDGNVIWIWDRGFPVRNPDGSVDRYIGVAQDITARKISDAMVRRQDTLDAIGHMTGGLAHDFNNILGVVIGHLDLIGLAASDALDVRESVDRALDAALRGARLARRLLALARREPTAPKVLALADAVEELHPLLQHAAGPEIALAVHADANPLVSVDPSELDAALINLVINARAAMPNGGSLTITLSQAEHLANIGEKVKESVAVLSVEDTGVGMDEVVLRRLGEPFFTTRDGGEGTGLGVSMVHAFVRQSGGTMCVDSTPGKGSRFQIMLPVAKAPLDDESQRHADAVESRFIR